MDSSKTAVPGTSASTSNSGSIEVDNSSSVLVKIASLYAEQLMSDIKLVVGGTSYPAHRLILCATSEVFQVMLMNREWSEWRESAIELKETPQCTAVFPHFLRYFYTGQIHISPTTVLPVLSLADKYNVTDLVPLCLDYMLEHLAHGIQHGQLIAWWQYTMACGHHRVAKECQNSVKWNIETLAKTNDFGTFEPEVLIGLLQQNDLVVSNELALLNFVMSWLEHQHERLISAKGQDLSEADVQAHMKELACATLSHIRYPMMMPREIANLLLHPFTHKYSEIVFDLMSVAMSFQSGHKKRVKKIFDTPEGKFLFTPRLYTEDKWGSMLTIENFHSMQCYHTRTFVFSTHLSLAEHGGDKTCEWVVDVYPKGVWFQKALAIYWQRTYEVPEVVLRTVRIAISCRDPPGLSDPDAKSKDQHLRVKIGILISGVRWGIEYITTVKEYINRFDVENRVFNIDDVLDFDELNTPIYSPSSQNQQSTSKARAPQTRPRTGQLICQCGKYFDYNHSTSSNCGTCAFPDVPINLIGEERDQLRIQIVIMPLNDVCCVKSPDFGYK